MKIRTTYRIIALTMAFLMFFTSAGFSLDLHFCKGHLKNFSFIGEAKPCHQAKAKCPHHADKQLDDKDENNCCSNEKLELNNLDKDFLLSANLELNDIQLKFVASFIYSFHGIHLPLVEKSTFLKTVDPLPPRDIYVLLERYLI